MSDDLRNFLSLTLTQFGDWPPSERGVQRQFEANGKWKLAFGSGWSAVVGAGPTSLKVGETGKVSVGVERFIAWLENQILISQDLWTRESVREAWALSGRRRCETPSLWPGHEPVICVRQTNSINRKRRLESRHRSILLLICPVAKPN